LANFPNIGNWTEKGKSEKISNNKKKIRKKDRVEKKIRILIYEEPRREERA
jgi:hypothetical protein